MSEVSKQAVLSSALGEFLHSINDKIIPSKLLCYIVSHWIFLDVRTHWSKNNQKYADRKNAMYNVRS